MIDLIEIAMEIDRILDSGIEIMTDSPIHYRLKKAIKRTPSNPIVSKQIKK